ncbi:MAG: class I SAM-dependent methyltransferase [Bryobacteraceae bacterium]
MRITEIGLAGALAACTMAAAATPHVRYLSFDEARDVLIAFDRNENASGWDAWVRAQDREVRARVDRGVEDSISNLILFGTSFTKLPRLYAPEAAVDRTGKLVDAALVRIHAAAVAISGDAPNERLRFARDFLSRQHVDWKDVEALLAANLTRFALEQRGYQEKLRAAGQNGDAQEVLFVRSTLFDRRGLSVDTSLLPNYALEDTLRAMLSKGALSPGSIGRIAVIGPGLDFTDKRDGYDLYPLQTIQPFAVMEAAIRLDLVKRGTLTVTTLDLNPTVNSHLRHAAIVAAPYVIQLPREKAADWTPQAVDYWQHFGDLIGSRSAPVAVPQDLTVRAVSVRPEYAAVIEPVDLNVVGQVMDGKVFDLVIATNILVYYDRFKQAVAMAAIARMMRPGGVFLSNTVLPAQKPADLEYLGRRSVSYSAAGSYGDDVVVYRRR